MALFRVYDNGKPIDSQGLPEVESQGREGRRAGLRRRPPRQHVAHGHAGAARSGARRGHPEPAQIAASTASTSCEKYSALGPEQAREAGSDIFGLENSLKAYEGRLKGLLDKNVWDTKRKDEEAFRAAVMANPQWKAAYGGAWDQIAQAEKKAATRLKEQMVPLHRFRPDRAGQ